MIITAFSGTLLAITLDTLKLAVALGTLVGFSVGGILIPSATIALIIVLDIYLATTVTLSLSIRTVGRSISFAIYSNIFINKLTKALPK